MDKNKVREYLDNVGIPEENIRLIKNSINDPDYVNKLK